MIAVAVGVEMNGQSASRASVVFELAAVAVELEPCSSDCLPVRGRVAVVDGVLGAA